MEKKDISCLYIFCIGISLFLGLQSCKTSQDTFTSKSWHNMNAKYNSLYLARETIREVEKEIFEGRKENYNRVLDVIIMKDTTELQAYDTKMQDVIKKSANIPNRHENSRWLDASYLLIGKARHYLRNYDDATNTFKYINTRGTDEPSQNRALIELLRTYIKMEDYRSAKLVLNEMRKRKMEKEEKLDFFLMRGHFYRRQNDYIETAKSLGSAVKIMPGGEKKARVHFILGQIYQDLENDRLADKNLKKVLKNNPNYELAFNTKLKLAQVSDLKDVSNVKKINKYFQKFLRDEKNKEYQDKVYYEMARFELRQGQVREAIRDLKKSTEVSQNPTQKAYSFLKLGEIFYEEESVQDFELAKTYYDSTIASMPKDIEEYKQIERRQKTLTDFVEQLLVYRDNDSLIRLTERYERDSSTFEAYLDLVITPVERAKQLEEDSIAEAQERQEAFAALKGEEADNVSEGGEWYFYKPGTVARGRQEFTQVWGIRALADNWRRYEAVQNIKVSKVIADSLKIVDTEGNKPLNTEEKTRLRVEKRKKEVYASLLKTDEAKSEARKQIEVSAYELGKILKFRLNEPGKSVFYFEDLLERFPTTNYEPEVLYLLYLTDKELGNKRQEQKYRDRLVSKYPKSTYAKRILDPNWLANAQKADTIISEGYKRSYELFRLNKFEESLAELDQIMNEYPDNLMEDRFILLRHLIVWKSDKDSEAFKQNLDTFIVDYPKSELIGFAKELLDQI